MSDEDSEALVHCSPPILIKMMAQIMTGLHFLESVGATFIFWLFPWLTPEPRIHQYISSTSRHHHEHEHERHIRCRRGARGRSTAIRGTEAGDEMSSYNVKSHSMSDEADPASAWHCKEVFVSVEDLAKEESRTENWARAERELLEAAK
ncbi:hypothetical protein BDZ97DRAFT_1913591 [Flammula alnicola]|nr:hypothetical protein BDZ97DRAFT_1913591 [Flammula alnicola]